MMMRLLKDYFTILCVCLLPEGMSVHHLYAMSKETREGVRSLELQMRAVDLTLGPLEEQQVLSTAEPAGSLVLEVVF